MRTRLMKKQRTGKSPGNKKLTTDKIKTILREVKPEKILSYITVESEVRARELMSSPVLTARDDWKLTEALQFFFENKITGAPVIDDTGRPVGVVTLRDIAHYTFWHLSTEEAEDESPGQITEGPEEEENEYYEEEETTAPRKGTLGDDEDSRIPQSYHLDRMAEATVKQILTPSISVVKEHVRMIDVIDIMLKKNFHRVFVIGSGGLLKGVISTVDIVRWLASELEPYKESYAKK